MTFHTNPLTAKRRAVHDITARCSSLAEILKIKQRALTALLLEYESFETARDEIWRSIDCLENISKELKWMSTGKASLMCTFFPVNLPLYSIVIFALVPSFMIEETIVRPPILMRGILEKIWQELDLSTLFPNVKLVHMDRTVFTEAYVSVADVVLFTGRYQNAKFIQKYCPNSLFIYNGAGINPVIVTDSANLLQAVHKTVEMRTFNSGQDCAGSDVIFVHQNVIADFKKSLIQELDTVKVGDYTDKSVTVGPIVKIDHLPVVKDFLDAHAKSIVYGGKINFKNGIVYPTVVTANISEIYHKNTNEFFSPVFYLVTYRNDEDLKKYFTSSSYTDYAMYVSVFGDLPYASEIPNSIILQNQIVNDVERGNTPYGGYGPKANYISFHGKTYSRPILISFELSSALKKLDIKKKVS